MIVEKEDRTITMSREFEKTKMTIDADDMSHIFEILSAPYSNEIQAVIREYSTNAHDEHVKHGITQPFRVTLPTTFEPMFKVRDFAKGLTHDQVEKIYAKYGKSTKRDINDATANNYNGQIGIGAKSGLCYGTKTFSVSSFVNGVQTVYSCLVDQDEEPTYMKLFSADTNEPDGLEISIPVEVNDINRFHTEAKRVYSYFSPMPEIIGLNEGIVIERPQAVAGLEGKTWRLTNGKSYAIMGNVAYPIDVGQINDSASDEIRLMVTSGIEIEFPIGELAFPPSREALKYTPRTKKNLNSYLEEIIVELTKLIEDKFTSATNIWEAKILYKEIFSGLGNLGRNLSNILSGRVKWNNNLIENDLFRLPTDKTAFPFIEGVTITAFSKSYRRKNLLSSSKTNIIEARVDNVVIINDLNTGKGSPSRLAELYRTTPFNNAFVISFDTDNIKKEFYKKLNFDSVPVKYLSQMDKPEVIKTQSVANSKHQLKCFKWDATNVTHGINSQAWTPETIDFEKGKGVYVKIERFEAISPNGKTYSPYYLKDMLKALSDVGIAVPTLYAIKPSMLEKKQLGVGWVDLWAWVDAEFQTHIKTKCFSQDLIDTREFGKNFDSKFQAFEEKVSEFTNPKSKMKNYLNTIINLKKLKVKNSAANTSLDNLIKAYEKFGFSFTKTFKASFDLNEMRDEINKTYPLLQMYSIYNISQYKNAIIEYVNLIDAKP